MPKWKRTKKTCVKFVNKSNKNNTTTKINKFIHDNPKKVLKEFFPYIGWNYHWYNPIMQNEPQISMTNQRC